MQVSRAVVRPAGGFFLWLELPKPFKSRALFDAAPDNGICFAPGDVFSAGSRYASCLRLQLRSQTESAARSRATLSCAGGH
jgi:DNA-binding transcriptional MocR family regulator